jgi:DNA polymerase alpha-associated DNA helicase A
VQLAQPFDKAVRPGDLARIEENVSGNGPKKLAKAKKHAITEEKSTRSVDGVVYKVRSFSICL